MTWTVTDDTATVAAARLTGWLKPGDVLAIPGGSTPGPVLALLDVPVRATLVDERHLPFTDTLPDESNTHLLRRHFTDTIEWARHGTLEEVRAQLEREVPDPDVVLLGMGPDGHIASLFPGREHRGSRILAITDSPKPPPGRLTMSLDLIASAKHIVAVVRGANKAEAVRRAYLGDPSLPTSHLDVDWILDPAAASLLETP